MLLRHHFKNKGVKFNSLYHRQKFSTARLAKDIEIHQSPSQAHEGYNHLLEISLQECKKIQSRQLLDVMPESLTFSLETARTIHAYGLKLGTPSDGYLGNSILDLYAKCGHLDYARKVFLCLERRDERAWNSIMVMKSRKGLFKDVLEDFGSMRNSGVNGNQYSFASVLSACAKLMDMKLGKQVHCAVIKMGLEANAFCEGSLINMYAKSDNLFAAKSIFDGSVDPDTVSWTAIISGFARVGLTTEAMNIFDEMQKTCYQLDNVMSLTILNDCVSQGSLGLASDLFSRMPNPNVVAWNVMISGHSKNGNDREAIKLFKSMIEAGIEPSRSTLGSVLSAIATIADYNLGVQVHSWAVKLGLDSNVYAGCSLLDVYAKCQRMEAARAVFDGLEEKNNVIWNALLGGYAQNGHGSQVMESFVLMRNFQFQPDEFTFTSMLSACACLQDTHIGRQLHSAIIKKEFRENLYVQNALVDMYAKCSALTNARKIFDRMIKRDIVSWNAIIGGYVREKEEEKAFFLFHRMMSQDIAPDEASLASILSAMANLKDLCKGTQVHCFLVKYGLERGIYAGCALIDMYCKSGMVEAATAVFSSMPERSLVCVNSLLSGHAQFSLAKAVNVFQYILTNGLQPSEVTFATLLEASSENNDLMFGRQLHSFIVKLGFPNTDEFLVVSLLGMYINSHRNDDAIRLFSELPPQKTTIIWTVMISGYAQDDNGEAALLWYLEMRRHDVMPDQATLVSVLKACSSLASLEDGRKIHSCIFHIGYDKDELTGSSLVDMYAKCGDLKSSAQVFSEMHIKKDVISWNSMIFGYAKNGYAESALKMFNEMQLSHLQPDEVTFLGVLTACSHGGMVSEGREIYNIMIGEYGLGPRGDHCACMVDLFGRWGYLAEAEQFINSMEFEPDSMIWTTYLNACRLHGDRIRGQRAAEKLIELEPQTSSAYVQLSHIHADSGNWDGVGLVRRNMVEKGVKKSSGSSKISLDR